MQIAGKRVIVTGAAHGIGRALAERFRAEGARVAAADIEELPSQPLSFCTDVSKESDVRELVDAVTSEWGGVDLFCSNAGIFIEGGVDAPDEDWERILSVNFRAHLYASRAVLPQMLARGDGY